MFVSLIVSHILFESPWELLHHPLFTLKSIPFLLSPGVLAFCMTSTEFELIRQTSVVTLSVGGMFKEVLTVLAGTIVFGDRLAVSNIWGVLVTLGGIGWYNYIKIQKMKEDHEGRKEEVGYEMVDREMGERERDDLEGGFATEHEEQLDAVHLKP
jgi:solute carrier family 35, member C2